MGSGLTPLFQQAQTNTPYFASSLTQELYLNESIDKNPLDRVKNLPVRSREPEPFTAEEIAKILNELDGQE
ncbi:MAG: hypothetical protein ACXW1Z_26075, partial [Methylobacter sp.]